MKLRITRNVIEITCDSGFNYAFTHTSPNNEFDLLVRGAQFSYGYCDRVVKDNFGILQFIRCEVPLDGSGEIKATYDNLVLPMFIRRVILRYTKMLNANPEFNSKEIEISEERLSRWNKNYSSGSGSSVMEVGYNTSEFLEECLGVDSEEADRSLKTCLDRIGVIAKNSTSRFWETRTFLICKDWDGFTFTVPGLFGGIVNHGTKEKPSWSIHT